MISSLSSSDFLDGDRLLVEIDDLIDISDLRDVQTLSGLRSDLCGVTVDRLTSGDDQVIADLLQRTGQRRAGCASVGTAELAVRDQHALIHAARIQLLEHFRCLRGTHGNDGDRRTHLLLQLQSGFYTGQIVRVDDAGNAGTDQRTSDFVYTDLCGIRYLFYKNDNFHDLRILSLFYLSDVSDYFSIAPLMTMRCTSEVPS